MNDEMQSLEWLEARLEETQHMREDPRYLADLPPELSEIVDELPAMEDRLKQLIAHIVHHELLKPFFSTPTTTVGEAQMKIIELAGEERRRSPGKSAEDLAKFFMARHYDRLAGRERERVEEHYVKLFHQAQHPQ